MHCAAAEAFLRESSAEPERHACLVGLDGFVDRIIRVVGRKTSTGASVWLPTLAELADRIADAAGQSTAMEMEVQQIKHGGNGPIMAGALAALRLEVTLIGAIGAAGNSNLLHPAFAPLREQCTLVPLCEAATTDALEFDDGKLMLQELASLSDLTWERLLARVGPEALLQMLRDVDLVALNHWASIPAMSSIWRALQAEVCPELPARRRLMFFDLADTRKRDVADVSAALQLIHGFKAQFTVMLGLNLAEAEQLALAAELPLPDDDESVAAAALATGLRDRFDLDYVVVHPRHCAAAATPGAVITVDGPYTDHPAISTGGGDHFNAGFCFGMVGGSSLEAALQLGVLTSGLYVRHGTSPTPQQLLAFCAELS